MPARTFSSELEAWLKSDDPKTFANLEKVFGDRSFGILFLVLMAFPALPIPTGGLSHVLEVLTLAIAVQPLIGLKKLWIPDFLAKRELPEAFVTKLLPLLMRRVKQLEKHSRVRGRKLMKRSAFLRFSGFCVIVATLSAMLAIPFSGLDTLPAIGVVVMSLGIILDDISFFIVGLLVGLIGLVLELTVGVALMEAIKRFLLHGTVHERIWFAAIVGVLCVVFYIRHRRKK